jgi:hypothetical protein
MSQISFSTTVSLSSKSKDIEGTALATLSALMKAIKNNNARPISFLLRERLQDRSERRQLNILLNAISTGLYRAKSQRSKKAVKPAQMKNTSTLAQRTQSAFDAAPAVKTAAKDQKELAAPRPFVDPNKGNIFSTIVMIDSPSAVTDEVDKTSLDLHRDAFGRLDIKAYLHKP